MSNLKLPTLTYGNLDRLLGNKQGTALAYATTAERLGDSIIVRHHGSPIVSLTEGIVALSKAGYNSQTTTQRLHKVLKDNNIIEGIGIRQGITSVLLGSKSTPMPRDRWVIWANGELQTNTLNEPA
jgi:hypothetical protein